MITLDATAVRNLFADLNHQAEVLLALYKLIFPNWERIIKMEGYPAINDHTWNEICELFIAFDHLHHPNVMPGGHWMNRGFSIDNNPPNWTASLDNCVVVQKG
jgi:hypothetical protein